MTLNSITTNGGNAYISGNSETLTNTNNTIQGTGIIGNGSLALINKGVIDATPEGGTSTLTVNSLGGFTSRATLEATGGATLALVSVLSPPAAWSRSLPAARSISTGSCRSATKMSNFGAINGGGATEVTFGSGTDRLIIDSRSFGGTVAGGGAGQRWNWRRAPAREHSTGLDDLADFGAVIIDAGAPGRSTSPLRSRPARPS